MQHRDAGKFVCTVEFEGGASLSVEMTLTVLDKHSGKAKLHFTALQNQSCRDAHFLSEP